MHTQTSLRDIIWRSALILLVGAVSAGRAMPTNVILFIGDGMGHEHVTASGMYAHGEAGTLPFESFPHQGRLTTHPARSTVPDSAATATAMATGVKVSNGVISTAYPGDGRELTTLLERAKAQGKSTGLVTTTTMTSATPAAFGAHERSRSSHSQIAHDYLTQSRPTVLFGGDSHMPDTPPGYTVVRTAAQLEALNTETAGYVSGQFASGHMTYEYDRTAATTEPHLSEMTAAALAILDNDPDGFFLMVEGGRIDHAAHDHDLRRTIPEVLEFSAAVETALDWALGTAPLDTLILVTADHETGGLMVLANEGAGKYPTVWWLADAHTGTNVPIYGWGPNSQLISGVMDNTVVYSLVMADRTVIPAPSPILLAAIGTGLVVLRRRRWRSSDEPAEPSGVYPFYTVQAGGTT